MSTLIRNAIIYNTRNDEGSEMPSLWQIVRGAAQDRAVLLECLSAAGLPNQEAQEVTTKTVVNRYIDCLPATYANRQNRWTVVTVEDDLSYPGNKTRHSCGHEHYSLAAAQICWVEQYASVPCPHVATGAPIVAREATTTGRLGLFCESCHDRT